MQNFENIQNLWHSSPENTLPEIKEIILRIRNARIKMIRRNIIGGSILCLTFFYICFIGWYYHFEQWTTRVGIVITLIAIVMGVVFNTWLVQLLLKQSDLTLDNKAYLQQLIQYRNTQHFIHTKGIALYYILLTVGIMLYMVEFAKRNIYFGIFAYTLTLGWIAFSWFYILRKRKTSQDKEINDQIENIERLIMGIEGE